MSARAASRLSLHQFRFDLRAFLPYPDSGGRSKPTGERLAVPGGGGAPRLPARLSWFM